MSPDTQKQRSAVSSALGTGLAWGGTWLGAGLVLLLIVGPDAADVPFPLGFGLLGFLAGLVFSTILRIVGRGAVPDPMSVPQRAAWGGLSGLAFAGLFAGTLAILRDTPPSLWVVGPIFGLAGAMTAAATLVLARRAS